MTSDAPETRSIPEVVAEGDRRASLDAILAKLAESLEKGKPYEVAAIAGRMQAVMRELADLPGAKKVSKADELASRRKARRSVAQTAASAAGGDH